MNIVRYYAVFQFEPADPEYPNDFDAVEVDFPDIPEAYTFGYTDKHARARALEVLQLCIETRRMDGEEIPPPSPPEKIPLEPGEYLVPIEYDADTFDSSSIITISDEAGDWLNRVVCPVCGYYSLTLETHTEFRCEECGTMGLYLDEAVPVLDETYKELLRTMVCPVCGENESGMYPDCYYGYKCSNPACGAKGVFPDRKAEWDAGVTFVQRKTAWDTHRKQEGAQQS